jgi:hypothetical protein
MHGKTIPQESFSRYEIRKMMIRKPEITRGQFAALLVVVILMCLIAFGLSGLVLNSEIVLMIIIIVAYAGIFPFSLGMAIQAVFRKKTIPTYAAWALAFFVVSIQWIFTRKTSIRVLEQGMISLIVSFFMTGVCVNSGFKSFRAFNERRKSKLTVN